MHTDYSPVNNEHKFSLRQVLISASQHTDCKSKSVFGGRVQFNSGVLCQMSPAFKHVNERKKISLWVIGLSFWCINCIALDENRPQVYNIKHLKPANEHEWKFGITLYKTFGLQTINCCGGK